MGFSAANDVVKEMEFIANWKEKRFMPETEPIFESSIW